MKERTIKHCDHCGYSLRETTIEAIAVIEAVCDCPNCGEKAQHFLFTEERNLPGGRDKFARRLE